MSAAIFLTHSPISLKNKKTQMFMADLKCRFDRIEAIHTVPTFPRLITRKERVKIFASYGGFEKNPYENEIYQKRCHFNIARNLDILAEYNEADKKCSEAFRAMVEKEFEIEKDFEWLKFLFQIYIDEVMPSFSEKTRIFDEVVSQDKIIILVMNAHKKFKETEDAHVKVGKNYTEALKTCYSLYEKYNKELAEAFLYKTNTKYYLIEWMMKPNSDDEENHLLTDW